MLAPRARSNLSHRANGEGAGPRRPHALILQTRGVALTSPDLRPDRSQRDPRTRVLVPGGRGPGPPEASGYQPRAAGRHSSLHLQEGALEDTPREQGWMWM